MPVKYTSLVHNPAHSIISGSPGLKSASRESETIPPFGPSGILKSRSFIVSWDEGSITTRTLTYDPINNSAEGVISNITSLDNTSLRNWETNKD